MSMTASVAYSDASSGQQESSTGLVTHRGQFQSALLRVIGSPGQQNTALYPRDGIGSGTGLELTHYPGQYSQVQSYDREHSQWLDLYLNAKNLGLNTQTGQPVKMPPGSANAVVGRWNAPSTFTPPQQSVWTETNVSVNCTMTGVAYRVDFACSVTLPSGSTCYVGIMANGGMNWPSIALMQNGTPNQMILPCAGFAIGDPPTPSIIRYAIAMYYGGPQVSLNGGAYASLAVTEMRA